MNTPLERLLARLSGVRQVRNGWVAVCPAHPDSNPSLSIRETNGKILLHCFAYCPTEAICAALEIQMRELFDGPLTARKPEPRIVREVQEQLIGLRSRLTPRDRERAVTVVLCDPAKLDVGLARALALAVEGELVQVALKSEAQ